MVIVVESVNMKFQTSLSSPLDVSICHCKSCGSQPCFVRLCETEKENMKITLSCLFGGSTGDDEVWVHPLQLCVHTHTPLIFCPLSIHLRPSSLQSVCHPKLLSDDSPRSVPPLLSLRNVIFHLCWVYMVSRALNSPSFPLFLFCHACSHSFTHSASSFTSSLHYLSRQNLLKLQMCREKKNKMGRALIPGIWDSPFRPGQNEPRSVWFGQCYSCLSKWPQVPGCFEEKSTQTRAGTGLNLTTIFESFLPSKSFWLKTHTCIECVCIRPAAGQARVLMNGLTGNSVTLHNAKSATSE